jgi:hypothetical protein
MARYDATRHSLVGPGGALKISPNDEVARKLAMLIEGECEGIGPIRAAEKFGYSKQRYFQLRQAFERHGTAALKSRQRGPRRNHRGPDELTRQVVRHRFLDPDASAEVVSQKLVQCGWTTSTRSVQRVIAEFGLQKKTLSVPPQGCAASRNSTHEEAYSQRAM